MMKRCSILWAVGGFLMLGMQGPVYADAEFTGDFEIDESTATVITSEKLTFDQKKHYALFEGNVVVRDPSLRMRSDRMTVFFDEDNQAQSIEAVGRVVIRQDVEETTAWARKATYDVASGEIFMEGSPRIRRGRDILEGDTITFWRDDNKMICEPKARLVLFPDGEGVAGFGMGD